MWTHSQPDKVFQSTLRFNANKNTFTMIIFLSTRYFDQHLKQLIIYISYHNLENDAALLYHCKLAVYYIHSMYPSLQFLYMYFVKPQWVYS